MRTRRVITLSAAVTAGLGAAALLLAPMASAHPDRLQQLPVPASGKCTDAISVDAKWDESLQGGWSLSWAQWMNDGKGGPVCTRTLQLDNSTGQWKVVS